MKRLLSILLLAGATTWTPRGIGLVLDADESSTEAK
ncbi:MAG: hypothetical protein H6Q36_1898 [Chloroflexi bacterium]|jgi:hypothetical protein|nr:hypothetical protein [Chloroflexota bacterium]